MKKYILIIVVLTITVVVNGCNNTKVKSIKTFTYQAIDNFGKIQKGEIEEGFAIFFNPVGSILETNEYDDSGNLKFKITYRYNNEGQRIEENHHIKDGSIGLQNLYIYEDGNLVEEQTVRLSGKIENRNEYKYDAQNNLIEDKFIRDKITRSVKTYSYDDKGNLIEKSYYFGTGKKYYTYKYSYDDKHNLREVLDYNSDGSLDSKTLYEYKNNKLILKNIVDSKKEAYNYDNSGNLTQVTITNAMNNLIETWTYKYELDSKENWIKQTVFNNNMPKNIIEREIEYY